MNTQKVPVYEDGVLVGFRTEGQGETPAPETESEGNGALKEAGLAVVGGVRDGLQEIGNTIQWAGEGIGNALTGGNDIYWTENDGFEWLNREEAAKRDDISAWQKSDLIGDEGILSIPEVAENESTAGNMGRGLVQFMAGYGVVGKMANLTRASSAAGVAAQGLGLGAVTDFATFDAHEDRMSDLLRDRFGFEDSVTEWLQADDNDTILEGKMKNAIEGAGLGIATEGLFRVLKLFKKAKKVQADAGDEAAAEVMNDGLADIVEHEPELFDQLELFDEVTDPNLAHTGAGKEVVNGKPDPDVAPGSSGVPGGDMGAAADPDLLDVGEVTTANAKAADAVPATPKTAVNTDGLDAALAREIGLRRGGSEPDPNRALEGTLFNFDKMDSDIEIKEVLEAASDDIVRHGVKEQATFAGMVEDARGFLSEAIDVSPEVIDGSLRQMAQDAQKQQGIVIAGKAMVQSLSREIERLAYKIDANTATEMEMEQFVRYEQRLIETSANLKSVITGAAQTTAAGRVRTADWVTGRELSTQDTVGSHLSKDGGRDGIKARAAAIKLNRQTKGGEQGVIRIVDAASGSPVRMLNEVYINSILSGPKTHMINIMSNGLNTFLLPSEKMLGGALRMDGATMREGMRQFQGIAMALKDSFKMAAQSFKSGRNILDPEAAILEANGVDYNAIKYNGENPVLASAVNGRFGLGNIIRTPSRMLLTGDEFFKQLNYRANLYARLSTEAADMVRSGKLSKEDAGRYVADRMATAYNRKGGAKSQVDLDFAREATFTQDLRDGSLMKGVQDLTNRHPGLKFIMPFVRTPTNILKAGVQRTPLLRRLSKSYMDDLKSGDPRRVASAQGKMATGWMFWGMAGMMAYEGKITGSGPNDPALRQRMMETGWRPYSFVMRDGKGGVRYVEYKRFEPFAMFFGIAADVADIAGQVGEAEMDEIAKAAVIGLANNVTSKTFLQGLSDAVEALNDPERYGETLMRSYASSMVPFSAALREARKQGDPAMREVRSIVDAIKNTVPGFSDDLPAKRSWITGEPIMYPKGWGAEIVSPLGEAFAAANPIIAGDWQKDKVLDELARLDFAFSAPTRKMDGVELTTAQYSRLLELHGTVRIGRLTMKQALERAMDSSMYDLERGRFQDASDPTMNPRVKIVQRIIGNYRKAARVKLLREDAELRSNVESKKREAFTTQRSAYSGLAGLNN